MLSFLSLSVSVEGFGMVQLLNINNCWTELCDPSASWETRVFPSISDFIAMSTYFRHHLVLKGSLSGGLSHPFFLSE
jgi:hypothetical protein